MCVVSMVMDHYNQKWSPLVNPMPASPGLGIPSISPNEIAEFRKLLERAREYDKRTNQPHCEDAEKKAALKGIAKIMNIDISFVDELGIEEKPTNDRG